MEMFELRGDCRSGYSGKPAIDESAGHVLDFRRREQKMIRVCYSKGYGVVFGEKRPLSGKRLTHRLCLKHLEISLKELKGEIKKYSMVDRENRIHNTALVVAQ
jgi:hypothetical protein